MGTPHSPWGTNDGSINLLTPFCLATWKESGKNKGQIWRACLMKLPSQLLWPLSSHSLLATKLIFNVRCGMSCAPTCLCLCWLLLTVYRKWWQIEAGAMKRIFLDWSWHHLTFNPGLNIFTQVSSARSPLISRISFPVNEDTFMAKVTKGDSFCIRVHNQQCFP